MKKILLKYYPEIIGFLVFVTYLFTLSHSIGENDSGELAMAQATLSIPHPTGYPLFVLLGYLFNKIPLPFTTIYQLNLLCAVWCVLTIIVVIKISSMIIENFYLLLGRKGKSLLKSIQIKTADKILTSVFSGLMLAYSATFWLQSTRVEVYSLQIFISAVIIYFTLKIFINYKQKLPEENDSKSSIIKKWWIVFLFLGLGFANHMMTLYLIPATIAIFFFTTGINKKSFKSILILFSLTAIVSLLFYTGLMIRANSNPPWSFGDPSNIRSLFDHITAKKYSSYMFQGVDTTVEQTSALLKMISFSFTKENFFAGEFSFSLLFGIAGLILLYLFRKEVVFYFLLIIILTTSISISYKIPDINEYFLVLFLVLSLLSFIPIVLLFRIINGKKLLKTVLTVLLGLFIISQFVINYRYANRSDLYIFEDFYKASIEVLPKNSILLTDKWSVFMSPGLYYKELENFRKDVSIISPLGVFTHDWYNRKYNNGIFNRTNSNLRQRNNIYISFDVAIHQVRSGKIILPPGSALIPFPYYYRLEFDNKYYPLNLREFKIRFNDHPVDQFDAYIYSLIPFMLEQRIFYELNYNQTEKARYYYNLIKKTFKDYTISQKTINALSSKGIDIN